MYLQSNRRRLDAFSLLSRSLRSLRRQIASLPLAVDWLS